MKIVSHSSGITRKHGFAPSGKRFVDKRKSHHQTGTKDFIAIDGEGINLPNGEHRYVYLGIGSGDKRKVIIDQNGLDWTDILDTLYDYYLDLYDRNTSNFAFVGFFLGYDFDRWLCTMPMAKVERLLTKEGIEKRRSKCTNYHGRILPVDMPNGWQVKMVGKKYFQFRRRSCHCDIYSCKCPGKGPWMRICDAGSFFQTSLLKAIDPKQWKIPIVTNAEYELVKKGKDNRDKIIDLDINGEWEKWLEDNEPYNELENDILARLLNVLNIGFKKMGIALSPQQWFGPGQAAQTWMKNNKIINTKQLQEIVPAWFIEAARMSYFGGWFEIMMHGFVPRESHEYDINSAYPYVISSLPCLLHGDYKWGNGEPAKDTGYVLVYASVSNAEIQRNGKRTRIGTMLHRNSDSTIQRPMHTEGWYWLHELNAAKNAELIDQCEIKTWMSYDPCNCPPPMGKVIELYNYRLSVDKKSPSGKAAKLAYNSMYGKFAQSIGDPEFANAIWASLITAGCRTMILNAIATHPKGQDDVCMVATDAVFFCTPHPGLPLSDKLGDWDYKSRCNLTLFKPGVYWDNETREAIEQNRDAKFKARGFASADFASRIMAIDFCFVEWYKNPPELSYGPDNNMGWPTVEFQAGFLMVSCLQAIRRGKWEDAGKVITDPEQLTLHQNANPYSKRIGATMDILDDGRKVFRSIPRSDNEHQSMPYLKRFGIEDPWSDESMEINGLTLEMPLAFEIKESLGIE